MRFFRVQGKGIRFEDMVNFNSVDGGDDSDTAEGLAVSGRADGLDGGSRFGGSWDAMDNDDEVIVLEGTMVEKIYDGYRIRPTREIARFTVEQWTKMLESGEASNYE